MPIRTLLFLTFLCTAAIRLQAQDYYESAYDHKPVSLGIAFSPNINWLRYGDVPVKETSAEIGYAYGLIADFAFAENYYFSTGLMINNLRASSQTYLTEEANSSIRLNHYKWQYAEVPLGVKLKSTQRYYRSYYGQFGFTVGVKLSAKQEQVAENSVEKGAFRDMGNDADIFRLGLQIGGGVEWLLDHNLRLLTGLSLNNGFTAIVKDGSPRNTYVAVTLGILF